MTHLIIGAGPVGSTTATLLADAGEQVRLVTRSGSGPEHPRVERIAADASDPARLAALAQGAAVIYNCANPAYHRWPELWPPLAGAMLHAAEAADAVLVITGNLYGYGPVDAPMTEDTAQRPSSVKGRVRVRMWEQALAAHRAGRVRVTEARASDFLGTGSHLGTGNYSLLTDMVLAKVVRGQRAVAPVGFDVPHSWTYIPDVARTLITLGADERAWGRAWHVPTAPPVTLRQAAARACELVGAPAPKLTTLPAPVVWAGGLFSPMVRGFREVAYQFQRPFVLDSTLTQATFGLSPTSLDDALRATAGQLFRLGGAPAGIPRQATSSARDGVPGQSSATTSASGLPSKSTIE